MTDSPLTQPTLLLRMRALADQVEIKVLDVPIEEAAGLAGFVAVGYNDEGDQRGLIGLAEDLDDDLRVDVLAFGIAVFAADSETIANSANSWLGIGRERLTPAKKGVGNLAWHMLHTCGRNTPSATFELVSV
jgi:hypothetical protein